MAKGRRITEEQKEVAISAVKEQGTMLAGAAAAGIIVRTLNNEMNRSAIFKRRILEAREEGYRNIADRAIEMIKLYASGEVAKTDRNVLTANIALANWAQPGFRGQTVVQGRIEHDVRVITAVPRPKYEVIENKPLKALDKGKEEAHNTVEDVIEGEVINE